MEAAHALPVVVNPPQLTLNLLMAFNTAVAATTSTLIRTNNVTSDSSNARPSRTHLRGVAQHQQADPDPRNQQTGDHQRAHLHPLAGGA